MAHSYKSEYPTGIQVDEGIKQFFEQFYKISDAAPVSPDAHEQYADAFTKDATLIVASKKGVGRDEILKIRKSLWEAVASRLHTPIKIFPFGSGSNEVMLYGTVAFTLKDARKATVEWAAKATLAKDEGRWKMSFYQVYMDTAAVQNAK